MVVEGRGRVRRGRWLGAIVMSAAMLAFSNGAMAASKEGLDPVATLPDELVQACSATPATGTGLRHYRCGETRLLITQPRPVMGAAHQEILQSVLDLVPAPAVRREVSMTDPDMRQTRVDERRMAQRRGVASVSLRVTTRASTGRSVVCVTATTGKKRVDQVEEAWCARVVDLVLPAPPSKATDGEVQIEVRAPDFPDPPR